MNSQIEIKKVNESYYAIKTNNEQLSLEIFKTLSIKDESSKFKPKFRRYGEAAGDDTFKFYRNVEDWIIVPSGLMVFLEKFGIKILPEEPEFTEKQVSFYLENILKILPFPPYQHQIDIFKDSILKQKNMGIACTGAGKSLSIALIADFLYKNNKKVLILVPNISLVIQIKGDFADYNLNDLVDNVHLIGGENQEKHFNKPVTIGTWQSIMKMGDLLKDLDAVIVDESHGMKIDTNMLSIVLKTVNAKFRLGVTGTLPEAPQDKMAIFSVVGKPTVYMRTSGLVKLGMATPLRINTITLDYDEYDKRSFRQLGSDWHSQLTFIKEHDKRNEFISKLAVGVASKQGNTVILTSHVQHGIDILLQIYKLRYPDVEVQNKDVVGKKAFEFQSKYRIYFINGATEAKQREEIRKILEVDDDAILVSNYKLLSTGINIKKLSNIILASPMKAFTTITQSIGRALRLHVSKEYANVYDIVDHFSDRCVFMKQYEKRLKTSYAPEGFELTNRTIRL